jgi:hypothetical protein
LGGLLLEGFQQDFSFFYARAELVKDKKPFHGIKVLPPRLLAHKFRWYKKSTRMITSSGTTSKASPSAIRLLGSRLV